MSTPITAVDGGAVQAVSFDVDGTLYRPGLRMYWRALLLGAGRPLRLLRPARDAVRDRHFPDGDALRDAVARELSVRAGLQHDEAVRLMVRMRDTVVPTILRNGASRDVVAAITHLKAAGLRLAAFSDLDTASKLTALGFPPGLFDVVLAAEDCGAYKPAAPGFARLVQELAVPAATVVHVGDRADTDVAGAQAAGMVAALLADGAAPAGAIALTSLGELVERILAVPRPAPAQRPAA